MDSPEPPLTANSYYAELAALGLPASRSEDVESRQSLTRGVQAKPPLKYAYLELPSRTITKRDREVLANQVGVPFANRALVESVDVQNGCTRVDSPGYDDAASERGSSYKQEVELRHSRQAAHDCAESLLDIIHRLSRMESDTGTNSMNITAILKCVVEMKMEMQQNMTSILRCMVAEKTALKQSPQEDAGENVSRAEFACPEDVEKEGPQLALRRSARDSGHSFPNVDNGEIHTAARETPPQVPPITSRMMQADGIKASTAGDNVTPGMLAVTGGARSPMEEFTDFWKCAIRTSLENVEQEMKNEMARQMVVVLQSRMQDLPTRHETGGTLSSRISGRSYPVAAIPSDLPVSVHPSKSYGAGSQTDSSVAAFSSKSKCVGPDDSPVGARSVASNVVFDVQRTSQISASAASAMTSVSHLSSSDGINYATSTHDFNQMDVEELNRATKWTLKLQHRTDSLTREIIADFGCTYRTSLQHVNRHKDMEELRSRRTRLQRVLESTPYQSMMLLLVVTQAAGMGVEAQRKMRHHWMAFQDTSQNVFSAPPSMYWFNASMNALFCIDLVLRIGAWRGQFCRTQDKEIFWWNLFDCFLVAVASFEFFPENAMAGTGNLGLLRSMRLLRAVRILRMVSFFAELRKMVMSFFGGMTQLFWVGTLLSLVLYVFALLFMQGASDELENMDRNRLNTLPFVSDQWAGYVGHVPLLLYYHVTVKDTMINLFATITGGREWTDVLGTLMLVSDLYYWVSVIYVLFFVFGFLNIVTAMFVDRAAISIAKADAEAAEREQAVNNHRVEQRILELFGSLDHELFLDELIEVFKDAEIQEWLFTIGVDLSRNFAHIVAMLLPKEQAGCTAARFLKMLRCLKGDPTTSDFQMLLFETRRGLNISNAYHRFHQEDMARAFGHLQEDLRRHQEDMKRQRHDMKRVCHVLDVIVQLLPAPRGADVNV